MRLFGAKRLIRSQVCLVDQHNERSSEDVSASFSKRKERDGDLNDINSTSNKLCAMNIKMEKKKYDQLCEGYPTYAQFVIQVLFHVGF